MISFSDIALYFAERFREDTEFNVAFTDLKYYANEDYETFGGNLRENYIHIMCLNGGTDTNSESYNLVVNGILQREYVNDNPKRETIKGTKYDSVLYQADKLAIATLKKLKTYIADGLEIDGNIESGFIVNEEIVSRPLTKNNEDVLFTILFTIERKKCKGNL